MFLVGLCLVLWVAGRGVQLGEGREMGWGCGWNGLEMGWGCGWDGLGPTGEVVIGRWEDPRTRGLRVGCEAALIVRVRKAEAAWCGRMEPGCVSMTKCARDRRRFASHVGSVRMPAGRENPVPARGAGRNATRWACQGTPMSGGQVT